MRRAREIWVNLVRQFERSGLSQQEFADKREIPLKTLRSWIYKLRREEREKATPVLPVRVIASTAPTARRFDEDGAVEVMLVRFAGGASSDFIADVVSRLRRC